MQIGDTLGPALLLPGWINSALAFFLMLGFPLALFFAWAFELTPEGLKKEGEVDRSESITHGTSHMLNFTIVVLLVLGNWGCERKSPTQSNARPLQFTPESGPFEGDQLVFIDVEEPADAIGSATMACRFGQHAASRGDYDTTSGLYVCRTPAHQRPESVILTITLNGVEFHMPKRYIYTTPGNSAAPVLGIDVPTIQQQVKRVREVIPRDVAFAAVIKNGGPPGLLADAMARATGIDYFCVPNMQDGIALREAGVKEPIMVLYLTDPTYAPVLLHYNLEPAASSLAWVDEANRLLQHASGVLQVHLWIDTGMGREGVMPVDALALAHAVNQSSKLHLQGIATHFCCNYEEDLAAIGNGDLKNRTALHKSRFDEAVAAIRSEGVGLDAIIHAGASAALRHGTTPVYYDMLRIGTMLFENPSPEHRNYAWRTKILQVKTLPEGSCLDYDCLEPLDADTPVGLVTHIPNDEVTYQVRGQMVETLADHEYVVVLDLSRLPDVQEGEEVEIILPDPNSPLDSPLSVPVTLREGAINGVN